MGPLLVFAALLASTHAVLEVFCNSQLVSGRVDAASDQSLSLTCREDKSKVLWIRKQNFEVTKGSILSFDKIRRADGGDYVCKSVRSGEDKLVTIVVGPKLNFKKNRWKREEEEGILNATESTIDITTDYAEVLQALPAATPTNRTHKPFLATESSILRENQLFDYSGTTYKSRSFFGRRGTSYGSVIAAVVGVILLVGGVLYRLLKRFDLYAVPPERTSETERACHHPICGQYCTFAGNQLSTIQEAASRQRTPTSVHEESALTADLPPSYENYLKSCDLPPSYSEALSYMSVYHLPGYYAGTSEQSLGHRETKK